MQLKNFATFFLAGWLPLVHAQAPLLPSTPLGKGWQCLLAPTAFFGPGTIFAERDDGLDRIIDLAGRIKVDRNTGSIPEIIETRSISSGFIVRLLKAVAIVDKLSLGAQVDSMDTKRVSYHRVTEEQTDSTAQDIAEAWMKTRPDMLAEVKKGVKYHFVRASYLAESISFDIAENIAGALGGEAVIKKLAQVKIDVVDAAGTKRYLLSTSYSPPLRVSSPQQVI